MLRGVERSDSLRSDASSRPKVSFNRDVHIKRIGPRHQDWRKDVREAQEVLRKARSVESVAHDNFHSLPRKAKDRDMTSRFSTLSRTSTPLRNPTDSESSVNGTSLPRPPRRTNVSIGTHSLDRRVKPRSTESDVARRDKKQQLSPILETTSAWQAPPLYATVNKSRRSESDGSGGRSNMEEPSARIRRLIGNTEGYLSPARGRHDPARRHSSPLDRPPSEHVVFPTPALPAKKKKSLPDKVKSLFSKKKKDQENKDPLSGRYIQYNGYNVNSSKNNKNEALEMKDKDNWFKSIDRRIRRNNSKLHSKAERKAGGSSSQEDTDSTWRKPRAKPLRYFGDTEDESDYVGRRPESTYTSNSANKDDLSGRLDSGKRSTVSRSVSVLAPWTPRHKPHSIDYSVSRALSADELDSTRYPRSSKFSSGDETDPPVRPPRRKLVFTGPSFDSTHRLSTVYDNKLPDLDTGKYSSFDNIYKVTRPLSRSTSLYTRDTDLYHGKTRK